VKTNLLVVFQLSIVNNLKHWAISCI